MSAKTLPAAILHPQAMARRNESAPGGIAAAFAPLKPLIWLGGLLIVALFALMILKPFSETAETPAAPVVVAAGEPLREGIDFTAREWLGAPDTGVPTADFQPVHTISITLLRADARFTQDITLNFRIADPKTVAAGLRVARYDDVARLWREMAMRRSLQPGVAASCSTREPGYYALGRFAHTGTPPIHFDTPQPRPDGRIGENAFAIMANVEGTWQTLPSCAIEVLASEPGSELLRLKAAGNLIAALPHAASLRWYLSPSDAERDLPYAAAPPGEEAASRVEFAALLAGDEVVFQVHAIDGEVLADARVPRGAFAAKE